MNPHKDLIIQALGEMLGDNYARAKMAFRNCTPKEMQQEYGCSGNTRQEILDGYEKHYNKVQAAIEWVKTA